MMTKELKTINANIRKNFQIVSSYHKHLIASMKISITNSREHIYVHLDQFLFAEADGNYVDIHLTNGSHRKAIRMLLKQLEELINAEGTYQQHHILKVGRSYLINTDFLVGVNRTEHYAVLNTAGGNIKLDIAKTDANRLLLSMEKNKRLEVLQTYSYKQKLTVSVNELNDTVEEFVDLGLPSGTLWASCNVDAKIPEQPGELYPWHECHHWSLPSREDFEELKTECVWTFCTVKTITGCLVQGPNGNVIFLPCAGLRKPNESSRDWNVRGCYWTATEVNDKGNMLAYSFDFEDSEMEVGFLEGLDYKEWSYAVRLVKRS